jgi:peptide-methionine (R)-S-oxide reductase
MKRRKILQGFARAGLGLAVLSQSKLSMAMTKLMKSKSDWQQLLPAANYAVLFKDGTERAGSSPLNDENRAGTYVCFACNLPLFKSELKFDSGTGWPSFFDVIPDAVETRRDFSMIWPRTEYHCARCDGHQGHLFKDGPQPTGLRYCNNGVALQFIPAGEKLPELRT